MSTQYSGPPVNGGPFPGPPGGKAQPPMMGRPPFSGPPKFAGPPATFNGRATGPPTMGFSGPPGSGPPLSGPPSGGFPPRGPPSSVPLQTNGSFAPPKTSTPQPAPIQQFDNMSLNNAQPPKAPSPASNLFGAPSGNNFFDNSAAAKAPAAAPPASAPSHFAPPANSAPSNQSPFTPSSAGNTAPFAPPTSTSAMFGAAPPNAGPFGAAPPNSSPFGSAPPVSNAGPPVSNASPFGAAPSSNAGPFSQAVPNASPFGGPVSSSTAPQAFGAVPPSSSPGQIRPPASNNMPFPPSSMAAPSFPSQPPQNQVPFGAPASNMPQFPAPSTGQRPAYRPPFAGHPTPQPSSQFPPSSAPASRFGPPSSNGPMAGPPSNNLNTFPPTGNSHSPGLQGISTGAPSMFGAPQGPPASGAPPMFGAPQGPPASQGFSTGAPPMFGAPQGPPASQFGGAPPSGPPMGGPPMGGPPMGSPPISNGPPSSRGYPGPSASGPRRPGYPAGGMSYGVSAPATLASPTMPPAPDMSGQGARHPTAPIIANPGASLGGQIPSIPQQPHAQQQPQAQNRKIDPDLMPNPLDVQKSDQAQYEGKSWVTTTPGVPPLVTTKAPLLDMGNCSPRYIRSAFYSMPATKDLANQISIPLSFAIQPVAALGPGEAQLATVDMAALGGPLRCRRCKAYINPFVKFVDGGRKFICNLCNVDTEVPAEYFCNLDHTGRRADTAQRAELSRGSFELLTTPDYCKGSKQPAEAAYIFAIDVTYASFQSGMVQTLTSNISAVLANLPKEEGQEKTPIRVGFITYNTQLHFYNLNPSLAQPSMLVSPDLTEVIVPMVEGFLVTLEQAQTHLATLMELIPSLHGADKKGESLMLPAIQAGCAALKAAGRPGKVILFHSSLPTAPGPGQLKNREDKKLLNTDKEATLLLPADPIYEKVARECTDNGVGVDLFLFPHSYVDLATIGKISTVTGGVVQRYPMFRADADGERFIQDLAMHVAQPCVFDAVLRMRTNAGIRPVEFCGNFMMQNATDVEIAVLTPNTCVSIEVKHDDKLNEDFQAYVQVALLYTSMSGCRKLRLHNLALPVSGSLAELYKGCDMDTILTNLSKEFGKALLQNHTYKSLKEGLFTRVSASLACYRQNCSAPSQPGQLILPETLKLLPLYSHCLLRSPALLPSVEVGFDEKSNLLQRLAMMTVEQNETFLYPRLYSLNTSTLGNEGMPPVTRPSYDRLRDAGAHLLDNGLVLILWVGANTPTKWLQEVFGVTVLDQVDPTVGNLAPFDNPTSIRVRGIVDEIRRNRGQHLRLNVVRQRDNTEYIFMQFLVEDKVEQGMNYTDFLCSIHREIRNILS